ncbi:MAG TPA: MFS transporter [Acidimicrobiales bacterium]|nr:MFS transporter [Acidimicrobiales bacterium]
MAKATAATPATARSGRSPLARALWYRQLEHYPDTGPRIFFLAIVVLATIVLYYELYVAGSVAPAIISQYHMSFRYYVYISVVANAVGAFSSLVAGLADRWGRANLVAYGLAITGLLVWFAVPAAPSKLWFALTLVAVGFVEGIILVATPALVRDFSPQVGRGSAMGFWTLGPVIGSLVVSEVSSHTLASHPNWHFQFQVCGIVGIALFVVALFGLRELSPQLRDQLMVSMRDRALIEARAAGVDVEESLRHPWRQMMHADVIGSAFAISVFLIIYYTAVGFFTIYFTTIFGFSLSQANGIGNWFWAFDAGALVVVGLLSDRLRVRKPFMVVGGLGAIAMTVYFLTRTSHLHTGYYHFVWIVSLLAVFLAIAYAPWMASFTETVERRNPALTATGLAVWGWILRAVVALSIFVLPLVVASMTPLVDYGTQVSAAAKKYAPEVATASAIDPSTLAVLSKQPTNGEAALKAVGEVEKALSVPTGQAVQRLLALASAAKQPDFRLLVAHGPEVIKAAHDTPGQWRSWWWVCVGGEAVFLPLIVLMAGRWSPRRAKEDAAAHQAQVEAELARLGMGGATGGR